jgi:hypothetical protein
MGKSLGKSFPPGLRTPTAKVKTKSASSASSAARHQPELERTQKAAICVQIGKPAAPRVLNFGASFVKRYLRGAVQAAGVGRRGPPSAIQRGRSLMASLRRLAHACTLRRHRLAVHFGRDAVTVLCLLVSGLVLSLGGQARVVADPESSAQSASAVVAPSKRATATAASGLTESRRAADRSVRAVRRWRAPRVAQEESLGRRGRSSTDPFLNKGPPQRPC